MKNIVLALSATTLLATAAFAQVTPGAGFINGWDYDQNGQVTVEEITERRGDIFVTFDADENGFLSAEEYVAFDEARAADQAGKTTQVQARANGPKPSVGMTLEFNDVDGDGRVSTEEFLAQSPAWFALLDTNADGVVTSDDFGRP